MKPRFKGVHLRVLNVPIIIDGRPVGTLQAATSLDVVDTARDVLAVYHGHRHDHCFTPGSFMAPGWRLAGP